MKEHQFERWAHIREKGKDNFVWMTGVAGWGLATGLLYAVVTHLMNNSWEVKNLWSFNFVSHLSFSLLFFALTGFVLGRIVWNLSEKKYLKIKEGQQVAVKKKRQKK